MLQIDLERFKIPKKWYVLGDSVSKGIILDDERGRYVPTPNNFIDQVAKAMNVGVKNMSMFGATVAKGLQVLDRHADKIEEGGLCIMEFGGNDSWVRNFRITRETALVQCTAGKVY